MVAVVKQHSIREATQADVLDITNNLASLPFEDDDEEMARRFDLLMLNLQLAILESSPREERYQRQVMTLMGNLEKSTISLRLPNIWN